MRKILLGYVERQLPEGYDVQKDFGPHYNPWEQRLCLVPSGDLFRAIRKGKADVVTDTIDRFTPTGIRLNSGRELPADIIITATGLNLQLFGGATVTVDGQPVDLTKTMAYKGMMLSGLPNMVYHGWLHQRVVDAEGRPGVGIRLPVAELHGRQRF